MRIVVDLEGAQMPGARHRGIGRYSIALAQGLLRHAGAHEMLVALNGAYPETLDEVRQQLDGLIAPRDIRVWHASLPAVEPATPQELRAQQLVREAFFASLDADVVHVTSMFPFGPHSFPSAGGAAPRHRTSVTLYDLIPHLRRDTYLRDAQAARSYDAQLEQLRRADLWLAISESSRREGIDHLALPADRVVSIPPAADARFTPAFPIPTETEIALRVHYGMWRPFAMYTGGADSRKNIDGLIAAWAALPRDIRGSHQLAIVCSVPPEERARLEGIARSCGLERWEVVFTGFVPEDHLPYLYRIAKLFVFPSLHEGFGLPALEAMSCGTPTIGANNSSIPEVIGREDAMFDGASRESMTAKLQQCLTDEGFRAELARHALEQARRFDWDRSAQLALQAIEQLGPAPRRAAPAGVSRQRPRLAFVSPLPPQRTGIADYSAQLLPALAAHYDIDVVVEQAEVDAAVRRAVTAVREPRWFLEHGHEYERIVYQFGNSDFHGYMLPLLRRHPGVVVLHDFFLSGMLAHRELATEKKPVWTPALYDSHGWPAYFERWRQDDMRPAIYRYPANFDVLRSAHGVIVHSRHSHELAREWYGARAADDWAVIPLVRAPSERRRTEAREALGLAPGDFLVCSFGIVGAPKLSDRVLRAWCASSLARDPQARLVFVGENFPDDFGREMERQIGAAGVQASITGWVDAATFDRYLDAADLAVQLRTLSRGETSAAVLDAMNHGVAVIANANGSMAYLPPDAVCLLPDEFEDGELVKALEALRSDDARRAAMGAAGRRIIETEHTPRACAAGYADAIEAFSARAVPDGERVAREVRGLLTDARARAHVTQIANAIAHDFPSRAPARQLLFDVTPIVGDGDPPPVLMQLAQCLHPGWRAEPVYQGADGLWRYARVAMQRFKGVPALLEDDLLELRSDDVWALVKDDGDAGAMQPARGIPHVGDRVVLPASLPSDPELTWACIAHGFHQRGAPRCLVDISELVRHDWQSGIQRVVKNDFIELLRRPPRGQVVLPVYARAGETGYRFSPEFLYGLAGVPYLMGTQHDDPLIEPAAGDTFFALDLQPHFIATNREWLAQFRRAGGRVVFMVYDLLPMQLPDCFVEGAAEQHEAWLRVVAESDRVIAISHAVAAQLEAWMDQHVAPARHRPVVHWVHLGADIATAGSIVTQGLPDDAQDLLQRLHARPSFLMVGTLEPRKAHAAVLDAFEVLWSRGVECMLVIVGKRGWMDDALAARLRNHPESARRLVWLERASDEFLESLYRACSALVLASRGEGFGLPLIEAAQRGLPLIARDLPVFREVAGDHAFYFADDSPQALADALTAWLRLREAGTAPRPDGMRWLTWRESAARVRRELEAP